MGWALLGATVVLLCWSLFRGFSASVGCGVILLALVGLALAAGERRGADSD